MIEPLALLASATALAALATAIGALLLSAETARAHLARTAGLADAGAAGVMMGAGYLLARDGLEIGVSGVVAGAALGVVATNLAQRWATAWRPEDAAPGPESEDGARDPSGVRAVVLRRSLHSALEGAAIAVAFLHDSGLGLFVTAALALHNVGEGLALAAALESRGRGPAGSAPLCLLAKAPQPVVAIALFAMLVAGPQPAWGLGLALGFGAGALLFLVLTELLPESYPLADHRAIAGLVSISIGVVLFLEDLFL